MPPVPGQSPQQQMAQAGGLDATPSPRPNIPLPSAPPVAAVTPQPAAPGMTHRPPKHAGMKRHRPKHRATTRPAGTMPKLRGR